MTLALVALGSNLAPRQATLRRALTDLGRIPATRLVRASRFRETVPVDAPEASPQFLNGACLLDTTATPRQLLEALQAIEARHGRVRELRHGPRTLDLDLILYGTRVVNEAGLVIPHPRAHERAFVLEPAADVCPELRHPLLDATWGELFERSTEQLSG